ncbi:MAG TPA: bL28 family ribosomal protein [Armatimonadota bacterium]|jgi:large subunit ribosomal protein L28
MRECHFCGKGAMAGRSHRHRHSAWAQRAPKTNRWFEPNLQVTHVSAGGGNQKRVLACAKCLKAGKSLHGLQTPTAA